MHTAIRGRQQTFGPADGSRTLTITNGPTQEDSDEAEGENIIGSLRLRGRHRRTQRVAWDEDVIDNEGCGKKKSKICCIYHKPRRFDESSSEESSDSDDAEKECRHGHGHDHNHDHSSSRPRLDGPSSSGGVRPQIRDGPSVVVGGADSEPNAYEKQLSSKKGKRRAA